MHGFRPVAGCRHGEGSAVWPGGQGGVEVGGRGQAGYRPRLDSVEGVERVSPTGRAGRKLLPEDGRPGGRGAGQGGLGRVLGRQGA